MKKRAIDLTEQEREAFAEAFPLFERHDKSFKWGEPWTHGDDIMLDGNDIDEMAKNYYKECEEDILEEAIDRLKHYREDLF